jgi:hypothetical protein
VQRGDQLATILEAPCDVTEPSARGQQRANARRQSGITVDLIFQAIAHVFTPVTDVFAAIGDIFAAIPHVLTAIGDVFATIDHIFTAVPNILEFVASSAIVLRVADIFTAIANIFQPIAHVFAAVDDVFAPIPHVFTAINHVFPAVAHILTSVPNILALIPRDWRPDRLRLRSRSLWRGSCLRCGPLRLGCGPPLRRAPESGRAE